MTRERIFLHCHERVILLEGVSRVPQKDNGTWDVEDNGGNCRIEAMVGGKIECNGKNNEGNGSLQVQAGSILDGSDDEGDDCRQIHADDGNLEIDLVWRGSQVHDTISGCIRNDDAEDECCEKEGRSMHAHVGGRETVVTEGREHEQSCTGCQGEALDVEEQFREDEDITQRCDGFFYNQGCLERSDSEEERKNLTILAVQLVLQKKSKLWEKGADEDDELWKILDGDVQKFIHCTLLQDHYHHRDEGKTEGYGNECLHCQQKDERMFNLTFHSVCSCLLSVK